MYALGLYPEDGPGRPEAWQRHIRGKDSEVEKSCQQGNVAQNLAGRRFVPDICGKQSPPARMAEVRKKVKIGDKIIIVPVKCGEGEQKGTVVGIYRSFATVKTEKWNLRECFVVGGNEAE